MLSNQQFVVYTATSAIAYSALYAYVSGAPYVFMVVYGLNEKVFGWIFALIAAGLISASLIFLILHQSQWLTFQKTLVQHPH